MENLTSTQLETIDNLVSYIPLFRKPGRRFQDDPGDGSWPVYHNDVKEFIDLLKQMQWPKTERTIRLSEAREIVSNKEILASADLEELAWVFTWWYETEKLLSGHWNADLESGTLIRMLDRLKELRQKMLK